MHIFYGRSKTKPVLLYCHLVAGIISNLKNCMKTFQSEKNTLTVKCVVCFFSYICPYRSSCCRMKGKMHWWRRYWTPTYSSSRSTNQPPLYGTSSLDSGCLYKRCSKLHVNIQHLSKDWNCFSHVWFHPHLCRQFPNAFFQGKADLCGCLCYEILKCCNHRSSSTQTEAAALLYFFMRKNFEFTKGKSIVRSHLQVYLKYIILVLCFVNHGFSMTLFRPHTFHFRLSRQWASW